MGGGVAQHSNAWVLPYVSLVEPISKEFLPSDLRLRMNLSSHRVVTFDYLWSEYEKSVVEDHNGFGKIHILDKLIQEVAIADAERAASLRWELSTFFFAQCSWNELRKLETTSTEVLQTCRSGFIENIDVEKAVPYFKARVKSTTNCYHRARISFCVWELNRNLEFAEIALTSLQEVAKLCLEAGQYYEYVIAVQTAYSISIRYNLKELAEKVAKFALGGIDQLFDKNEYRWLIEPMDIVAHFCGKNPLDSRTIDSLESKATEAVDFYHARKQYHLQRSLLHTLIKITEVSRESSKNKESKRKTLMESIAESWEKEADERLGDPNGTLASVVFYENAAPYYENAGKPEKKKMLLSKIRKATKSIKWTRFSSPPIRIPTLTFEGDSPAEIYDKMCGYNEPIPPLDFGTDLERGLQDTMSTITFDERYPISDGKSDGEDRRAKRNKTMYIQVAEARFASAVELLEKERKISSESMSKFIEGIGILAGDSVLMEHGIDDHFKGDYISSIHILVPQIEVMLREILNQNGIPIEKMEQGAVSVKEMGGILAEQSTKTILGEEFASYLQLKFTDKEGMNIRNEVAHGLMKPEKFNHVLSCSLIYVILKLCGTSRATKKP